MSLMFIIYFAVSVSWNNIYSKHSAILTIDNEDEKCLNCSITIIVKPSQYAREISAAFTLQTLLSKKLHQHIYKPTMWVLFTKLWVCECQKTNVDKDMNHWNVSLRCSSNDIYVILLFFKGVWDRMMQQMFVQTIVRDYWNQLAESILYQLWKRELNS